MRFKKIVLVLLLFLITGCTAEYNLVINNDNTVNESITMLKDNSLWGSSLEEINEQIDWTLVFAKDETEPAYFYNQQKVVGDIYSGVKYDYQFNIDEFKSKSEFLINCFDNYDFSLKNNILYVNATGFKCSSALGDNFDLVINIVVDGKKVNGNYHTKQNNKYTWNINSNDDVRINLSVELDDEFIVSDNNSSSTTLVIILIILVVLFGIFMLMAYKKNKENNS